MHQHDPHLAGLVFEYVRTRLTFTDTPLDHPKPPEPIIRALDGFIDEYGRDPREVLDTYVQHIAANVLSTDSPRFFGFIPAAPTKAALLFDTVVSIASLQGCSFLEASGAIVAENQVLRWIADLAGMPDSAGGTFVSGGSAANLSALAVARDIGRQRVGVREVRIACSDEAHSSVANACRILDVEPFVVPSEDHRLTGAGLRQALDDYQGPPVVAVVATAGTTNAGIIDDLAGIAEVCRERDLWLHVDGAYGGAALLSDQKWRFAGIEHADSFITDPHKWWFAPFDCAALLYRDPDQAASVHTQHASYLDPLHQSDHPEFWNPTDLAHHLSRRARGLPLWFSLAVHGTTAYQIAVQHVLDLTAEVAALVEDSPHVELVREPGLSIVLWRRPGWGKADYLNLQNRLLAEQVAFATPTVWEGEVIGRFALLHPSTTLEMVEVVLDAAR
ncbi:MAG: aminotransferase class I/II-fold pyridoxal phosphate-dependent enzyme [Mycobacterium sp.]|nr:MAG: aminotransferase class I/II-fold pyridoxal phosphate-dependent enzyme [Mycobacterium sp.]